jgi:hypothetical protein
MSDVQETTLAMEGGERRNQGARDFLVTEPSGRLLRHVSTCSQQRACLATTATIAPILSCLHGRMPLMRLDSRTWINLTALQ